MNRGRMIALYEIEQRELRCKLMSSVQITYECSLLYRVYWLQEVVNWNIVARRRTSTDTHTPATRSASSDSSTGSESSGGSGIRSTGAPFTAEEMKQKYLSRAPTSNATSTISSPHSGTPPTAKDTANASPTSRSFQSRFLGAGKFLL